LKIIFHAQWIDVKLLLNDNIIESSSSSFEKGKKETRESKGGFV